MAGLWNRIVPSNDRLGVHLLKAAIYLRVRNVFTAQQILNALNAKLTNALDAAAETDLVNIVAQASSGSATNRIDYLERWDALNIAAEAGLLTSEATWRSELNIS